MDLFEYQRKKVLEKDSPLALKMRPKTLEEYVGQGHIIGEGKLLYRMIKGDKLSSVIFYGPPGTGKTTLAEIIARSTKSEFVKLNATTSGIKDIKSVIDEAKSLLGMTGRKTILFVDEIHRFNKTQQDALLPHVEDATVVLIGATTENPYFDVNKALVSRSTIFQLKPLESLEVVELLKKAILDKENGFGSFKIKVAEDVLFFMSDVTNGDARSAYNALELAVLTTPKNVEGEIEITLGVAEQCVQKRKVNYDKTGDSHYDITSAFIKSMRGSDERASLYYLAKMISGGEDPKFIARRVLICASEDVGNADPMALLVASAAMSAVDFLGFPEARISLAQAVMYIANAKKSNDCIVGIDKALSEVENVKTSGVPIHLKDAHYKGAKELGNGVGYKYPHDYDGNYVEQQYLPDELV